MALAPGRRLGPYEITAQIGVAHGKELFFVSPDSTMMSVDINTGATFSAGIPRELFKAASGANLIYGYAVRNDGQQFLMPGRDLQAETWPITVVQNWWVELEGGVSSRPDVR